MNILKLLFMLLSAGFLITVPGAGTDEKKDEQAQRIISLGPALTEELFLLGAGENIVGASLYCRIPANRSTKIEKVSTAMNVNIEKIVSLKPDLVVATSLISPKNTEMLKNLGIKVVTFPAAESFNELCEQFAQLGRLVGKEKEALGILDEVHEKVEAVKQSVKGLAKPGVILQAGANPLWLATKNSFMNDFIEFSGGENLGPQGTNGHLGREQVLALAPEVIFITTMGIVGEEEKREWQKFTVLPAVKNNRIYIFDSDKFCSPTPVSFASTLKETAEMLHPETIKTK